MPMLVIVTNKMKGDPIGDAHHSQTALPIPMNHLAISVSQPVHIARTYHIHTLADHNRKEIRIQMTER